MRLHLLKSKENAALPSVKKGIITLIHIDEIIAMPKTDYQGIRCLNEIQLKELPQLQYLYLTPFTQKEEITPSGDIESTLFSTKISGTFPGNKIEAAEFLKQNINEPFVIIYEDFTENTKFIYGSKYHPLFIKSDYKSDSTGKLWNFTLEQSHASDVPYLYYEGPQLGGRNLLLNTKSDWQTYSGTGYGLEIFPRITANINETFTAKAFVRNSTSPTPITLEIHELNYTGQRVQSHSKASVNGVMELTITTENQNIAFLEVNLFFGGYHAATTYQYEYSKVKLERGNKATLWTPAPEDIIM